MQFTDEEYKAAQHTAKNLTFKAHHREEEVLAELYLWLCNNYKTVVKYRTEKGGIQKLYSSLKNFGNGEYRKTRKAQTPALTTYDKKSVQQIVAASLQNSNDSKRQQVAQRVRNHKNREALIDYFLNSLSIPKVAKKYNIHERTLYRNRDDIFEYTVDLYFPLSIVHFGSMQDYDS